MPSGTVVVTFQFSDLLQITISINEVFNVIMIYERFLVSGFTHNSIIPCNKGWYPEIINLGRGLPGEHPHKI